MKSRIILGWWALRPKQWTKNVLVLVAPFAAGVNTFSQLRISVFAFVAFSAASSIGYLVNDLNDIEIDRGHPKKGKRPFASGALSPRFGYLMIGLLLVFLVLLLLAFTPKFALVVYLYLFNSVLYTKFFKSYPVLEMFLVAVGFVLRLIAGALALNLALSEWFLIVGGFGALYIVSIKRLAELKQENLREVRKVINSYSSDFLNFVAYSSSSVTLTSYCLWAFDQVSKPFWYQISVLPFMIALFRFGWISDRKSIEVPEDTILHDRPMLFSSTVLIATLSIAVF